MNEPLTPNPCYRYLTRKEADMAFKRRGAAGGGDEAEEGERGHNSAGRR